MNTTSRWAARALAAALATGALLAASPARAESDLLKKTDKVGPMMANLRIGPAFAVTSYASGGAGFTLAPEFGYAVALENNLYVVASPQFTLGYGGAIITIPAGVQYDFPIAPVPNLYVTGRFLMGYANFAGGGGASAFAIIPEVGAKFMFKGRFNVGFEPFSMPVYISSGTLATYRLNLYGGINF